MLQQEDTLEVLFRQPHGVRAPEGQISGHYSWKHVFGIIGWAIPVLWCSWVTLDILSRRCVEQPHLVLCSSVLGTPLPVVSTGTIPSTLDPLDHFRSQVSGMEARLDMLESGPSRRNFATGGDGALILKGFTSPTFLPSISPSFSVFEARKPHLPPLVILDDSNAIGRCWEFEGSEGHVGVGLTEAVYISSLSLDHVHPGLVSPASSRKAPREFRLWGLYSPQQWWNVSHPTVETRPSFHFLLSQPFPAGLSTDKLFVLLVNGTYDTSLPLTRQSFEVPVLLKQLLNASSNVVVLETLSNWGAETTCLYSLGIHGESSV